VTLFKPRIDKVIFVQIGMAIFPRPVKAMGRGWGKILAPHHEAGQGWV